MGTDGFDEAAAWSRARGGDGTAFAALYDRHRDRVFGQALRLLRDPHGAEDVTAMVFLEAWRKRASVRVVDGSIVAWLLVTTNNVVRNHDRSARRYRLALAKLPAPAPQDDHAPLVDDAIDDRERNDRVRSALARLSARDQDIITLCVLEELPLAEAASTLGIPVGTVKSRLSRAKQRLAALAGGPITTDDTILEGGAR
ncbi:sigma-70 family RNA polymerase sigma factor [uncultured Leifsonia sp.]|uniref:RNA polymerase sigma factor n=1 Tax=uncultured Leifsonia sp. TaxID=340359 RepID=UPI0028D7376A|nr:sigma-70 family RNA polymerase sigma factor [uncultured Leifsonia sp.]